MSESHLPCGGEHQNRRLLICEHEDCKSDVEAAVGWATWGFSLGHEPALPRPPADFSDEQWELSPHFLEKEIV